MSFDSLVGFLDRMSADDALSPTDRDDIFRLRQMLIPSVHFVDRGANKAGRFLVTKSESDTDDFLGPAVIADQDGSFIIVQKAPLTTAERNNLPDSAFMHIRPGGEKDGDGRTVPRELRMFPVRDGDGNIDLDRVRNALSRIPQADITDSLKEKLTAEAQKLLEQGKEQTEKREHLTLPADFKQSAVTALTEVVSRITALLNDIKQAHENNDAAVPTGLREQLSQITSAVSAGGNQQEKQMATNENEMIQQVKALAQQLVDVAKQVEPPPRPQPTPVFEIPPVMTPPFPTPTPPFPPPGGGPPNVSSETMLMIEKLIRQLVGMLKQAAPPEPPPKPQPAPVFEIPPVMTPPFPTPTPPFPPPGGGTEKALEKAESVKKAMDIDARLKQLEVALAESAPQRIPDAQSASDGPVSQPVAKTSRIDNYTWGQNINDPSFHKDTADPETSFFD